MTIKEVATALGVSRSHVYRLIKRGELTPQRHPLYRKGGPVIVPPEQVEALRMQLSRS